MNLKKGFTLIELLVVVAIIGLLTSVVLASLNNAKNKGADAAIKANLKNATAQAEIFYNTNTANPNSYEGVCTDGMVGGAMGIGSFILAAAKARGLTGYSIGGGGIDIATCRVSGLNDAWAAEVPLKITIGVQKQMWCVDSTGVSKQLAGSSMGFWWACNF